MRVKRRVADTAEVSFGRLISDMRSEIVACRVGLSEDLPRPISVACGWGERIPDDNMQLHNQLSTAYQYTLRIPHYEVMVSQYVPVITGTQVSNQTVNAGRYQKKGRDRDERPNRVRFRSGK
jgi:hypothetical protein